MSQRSGEINSKKDSQAALFTLIMLKTSKSVSAKAERASIGTTCKEIRCVLVDANGCQEVQIFQLSYSGLKLMDRSSIC